MDHEEAKDAVEGALGTPAELPKMNEEEGGFDFWLFGLLAVVAVLVAVQNLWLRRRAEAENEESSSR